MYMAKIQIRTKIDITDSGVRRADQGTEKEFSQYKNFITFQQVIGMRSIFTIVNKPTLTKNEWVFVFDTDQEDVFSKDKDPVGLLKEDLDNIPVILGLSESSNVKQPIIRTLGSNPNTFVSFLS